MSRHFSQGGDVGSAGRLGANATRGRHGHLAQSMLAHNAWRIECYAPRHDPWDQLGGLKWVAVVDPNRVVTVGLTHIITQVYKGQAEGYGRRLPPAWPGVGQAVTAGDIVRDTTNGRMWIARNGGTTNGSAEPTWTNTDGATVTDNDITWQEGSHFFIGLTDGTPTDAAGDTMVSHTGWQEVTTYSESFRPMYVPGAVNSGSTNNGGSVAVFSITGTVTVGGAFLCDQKNKSGTEGLLIGIAAFAEGDRAAVNGDTINVTATTSAATA